eukprot:747318-Hanusia_phi.AAC.4
MVAILVGMQVRAMAGGCLPSASFISSSASPLVSSLRPVPWHRRTAAMSKLGHSVGLRNGAKPNGERMRYTWHDSTLLAVRMASTQHQASSPYAPAFTQPLVVSFDLDDTLWPTVEVSMLRWEGDG